MPAEFPLPSLRLPMCHAAGVRFLPACTAVLLCSTVVTADEVSAWMDRVAAHSRAWQVARKEPTRTWTLDALTEHLDGNRVTEAETERYVVVHHHGFPWDPLESTCRHASLSIL